MTESSPSSHGMSRKLPNAVPLDLYLTSSSDVVRELACYVYEQYVQQRNCPSFEKLYPTISCILLNLLRAYKSDTSRYVRFSRRTKDYTESRYNRSGISYRSMDRVVKALDRTLIEFEVGQTSYVQGELGRQSVMRATPTLIDLCSVRFEVLPEMIERSVEEEVIILKGEKQTVRIVDGRRIRAAPLLDYDDSDEPYPSVYVIMGLTGQLDMWRNRSPFRPNVVELIDLLNGAGAHASWSNTRLPDAQGGCP